MLAAIQCTVFGSMIVIGILSLPYTDGSVSGPTGAPLHHIDYPNPYHLHTNTMEIQHRTLATQVDNTMEVNVSLTCTSSPQ